MYPEWNVHKKKSSVPSMKGFESRDVVGLVVFDGEKFLLMHRKLHWSGWEFPKGHMIVGETVDEAIKRELFEETGLCKYELVGKIDAFNYFDNVRSTKTFIQNFLLHVSSNNKITFEHQSVYKGEKVAEHDGFKWCFPKEAVQLLKHRNMKDTMRKAIVKLGLEIGK